MYSVVEAFLICWEKSAALTAGTYRLGGSKDSWCETGIVVSVLVAAVGEHVHGGEGGDVHAPGWCTHR